MIGKIITHYKIIEKLGEGGMGIVYLAEDTKLKRQVAIKFLPKHIASNSDERKRFEIEAQAAAALNNPNIATIYAIEQTNDDVFIVMEYIPGQTLQEKIAVDRQLPPADCVDIATQIAFGLQAAHEKGIVHRDIKPSNIMITERGQVKIMDFGLAKIGSGIQLTADHSTMGTAAYMSPEQVLGEDVDQRTDIWSFGIVLYEMLTGELPFSGNYEQAILYSIVNQDLNPSSITIKEFPTGLKHIVCKSLSKNQVYRYQRADEILAELNMIHTHVSPSEIQVFAGEQKSEQVNSIAVLPFVNISSDRENEYFSDGITEELINALSKLKELRIVSRTSVFQFKGKPYDIREIGERLNVNTILEGSVRKAADKLRINVQLTNVRDGCHLWAESYDREMKDIFSVQEEISNAIVSELQIELSGRKHSQVIKRHTSNIEAYDHYLKGRFFWNNRQISELIKARSHFEKALEIEPEYALAYTGLADYYNMMGFYAFSRPKEVIPKAKQAALKALEIDDTVAEAHSALAFAHWTYDWDMRNAEKEFKRAIELNPNYSTAHMWYSNFLVMSDRAEEGLVEIEKALTLDPLSLTIKACSGSMFYFAGQYDRAINQCSNTLEMNPNFLLARHILTLTYEQQSKYMDAIKEGNEIRKFSNSPQYIASLAYAYARSRNTEKANELLEELLKMSKEEYVSGYHIASIYSGLNKKDSVFFWLEKAIEERSTSLTLLKVDPMFKNLHSDRHFNELLKKIGLE